MNLYHSFLKIFAWEKALANNHGTRVNLATAYNLIEASKAQIISDLAKAPKQNRTETAKQIARQIITKSI
jgi:hypothetical protein